MNIPWSSNTPPASSSTATFSGSVTVKAHTSTFYMVTSAWRQWSWHTTICAIARRAIALQKRQEDLAQLKSHVYDARNRVALRFECEHTAKIRDFNFKRGDLILMRNIAIEKALNRKMRLRYLGPMIVVSRNRGGVYIVCDLDSTLSHAPIAAFWIVPYLAR